MVCSWTERVGRTNQPWSRKYRFTSPVIVGIAYAAKLAPYSGV
jgi:hypothetical protein